MSYCTSGQTYGHEGIPSVREVQGREDDTGFSLLVTLGPATG